MCRHYSLPLKRIVFWVTLSIALSFAPLLFAWQGKVVKVADGDTITVLRNFRQIRIRFYGIDTPEKRQAFGKVAKRHLASIVAGRTVEIEPMAKDRYGRIVALVFLDGINLNRLMVQNGYAWVYRRYCKRTFCREWLILERQAREKRIGLWQDLHPVPPWEWRRQKRRGHGQSRTSTHSKT